MFLVLTVLCIMLTEPPQRPLFNDEAYRVLAAGQAPATLLFLEKVELDEAAKKELEALLQTHLAAIKADAASDAVADMRPDDLQAAAERARNRFESEVLAPWLKAHSAVHDAIRHEGAAVEAAARLAKDNHRLIEVAGKAGLTPELHKSVNNAIRRTGMTLHQLDFEATTRRKETTRTFDDHQRALADITISTDYAVRALVVQHQFLAELRRFVPSGSSRALDDALIEAAGE